MSPSLGIISSAFALRTHARIGDRWTLGFSFFGCHFGRRAGGTEQRIRRSVLKAVGCPATDSKTVGISNT
jgi:hypothetical protein